MPAFRFEYQACVENHVVFGSPAEASVWIGRGVGCKVCLKAFTMTCFLVSQRNLVRAQAGSGGYSYEIVRLQGVEKNEAHLEMTGIIILDTMEEYIQLLLRSIRHKPEYKVTGSSNACRRAHEGIIIEVVITCTMDIFQHYLHMPASRFEACYIPAW